MPTYRKCTKCGGERFNRVSTGVTEWVPLLINDDEKALEIDWYKTDSEGCNESHIECRECQTVVILPDEYEEKG